MHDLLLDQPLARGRTADVYPWGDHHVLKLFHAWFGPENIAYEARIARAVAMCGLPVPAPGEIIQVDGRTGLIYERRYGPSMWVALERKPWRIVEFGNKLALLHAHMHNSVLEAKVPAQRTILERKLRQAKALTTGLRKAALAALASLPDGDRVCHGDFHPGNILLTPHGEVIIDWMDASRGNPLADVARTTIIALGVMESAQIPNLLMRRFVCIFHAVYLHRYFRLRPHGRNEYRHWLPVVAAARLSENIPEIEEWLLQQASTCSPFLA